MGNWSIHCWRPETRDKPKKAVSLLFSVANRVLESVNPLSVPAELQLYFSSLSVLTVVVPKYSFPLFVNQLL